MAQVSIAQNRGALQVQEARETITSCLMYLYQGYVTNGMGDADAKKAVAEELVSQLDQWKTTTNLEFMVSPVLNPHRLLEELVTLTKQEATTSPSVPTRNKWQTVHRKLVDLRAMSKKEGA